MSYVHILKVFLTSQKKTVSRTESLKKCVHTYEQKMIHNVIRYYTLLWVFSKIL